MTDSSTAGRSRASLQTKALAGLVAVMIAAAIVALVFVTNGSGNSGGKQAGAAPSDVGHNSSVTKSASPTPSVSRSAPKSTVPAKTATSAPAPASTATATKSAQASTASSSSHSSDTKKVIYTVKKGDTLTAIGRWYSDHGYLKLYNWNKSVIGENPDLIFPGQKIIVVDGTVGVARHSG